MNTLSRATTAQLFPDPDRYTALRHHWRALLRSEQRHALTAAHHILYLALLGKDWRKGFTPITNPRKLANGAFYGWSLFSALRTLQRASDESDLLAPFAGLVTPAMLAQVRAWVPLPNAYHYGPDDFARGAFLFAAYCRPATAPASPPVLPHA